MSKSFNDDNWISWITSRAIICPVNEDCDEINEKMIKKIEGPLFLYKSIDRVHDEEEAHNYPTEFLNSLRLPSYPPHILELKRGIPFMLLLVPKYFSLKTKIYSQGPYVTYDPKSQNAPRKIEIE